MSLQTRINDLTVAIATDIKQIKVWVTGTSTGSLAGLTTTDKTSIINAINEVKSAATGAPPDATTTVKGVSFLASNAEALALASTVKTLTPGALASILNVANGLPKLDATGKVAAAQLPGFVDDVLEFTNLAGFPGTGTSGLMYVAQDTNKVYRWTGTVYVEISASPGTTDAVPEGTTNLYYSAARADARITALVGVVETDFAAAYATAKV